MHANGPEVGTAMMADECWPILGGCVDECLPNWSNTKILMEADSVSKIRYALQSLCVTKRDRGPRRLGE